MMQKRACEGESVKPKQDPIDPAVVVRTLSSGMKKELLLLFEDSQRRATREEDDNIWLRLMEEGGEIWSLRNDNRASCGLQRRKLVELTCLDLNRQSITPLGIQVAELLETAGKIGG